MTKFDRIERRDRNMRYERKVFFVGHCVVDVSLNKTLKCGVWFVRLRRCPTTTNYVLMKRHIHTYTYACMYTKTIFRHSLHFLRYFLQFPFIDSISFVSSHSIEHLYRIQRRRQINTWKNVVVRHWVWTKCVKGKQRQQHMVLQWTRRTMPEFFIFVYVDESSYRIVDTEKGYIS